MCLKIVIFSILSQMSLPGIIVQWIFFSSHCTQLFMAHIMQWTFTIINTTYLPSFVFIINLHFYLFLKTLDSIDPISCEQTEGRRKSSFVTLATENSWSHCTNLFVRIYRIVIHVPYYINLPTMMVQQTSRPFCAIHQFFTRVPTYCVFTFATRYVM